VEKHSGSRLDRHFLGQSVMLKLWALDLTTRYVMIDLSIMKHKTATVADLRNNFRRVSAWLENGESVEIIKRGRRFARLVPAVATSEKPIKVDFAAQLRTVWGQKVFSDFEIETMKEAELGSQS
jgi:antitoxin (DNA-binding transcriptional repressor) of toxin-antitoxin stability system